jgi:hypothetical protein
MRSALLAVLTLCLALGAPAEARAQSKPQSNRYLEAGIPAVSRAWSGTDYERAVEILSSGKIGLPRFADPQGAALLRRMTSTENFTLQRDKKLPMQTRMEDYLKMYQGSASLLRLYYSEPAIAGVGAHQELAAFLAFLLQGAALGAELTDEFMPAMPKDDQYETRMAGLKQMHTGMTQIFVGAEQALGDRKAFSADDRSVILRAMESTLPRLKTAFPEDVRIELRKKLEEDKTRFTGQEDLQRLSAMIRELSAA